MFPFPHDHPETGLEQEEELRTLGGPNIKSLCSNFEILLWLAVSSHLHLWAGEQPESPYLGRKNTRMQWSDLLLPSSFDNGADGRWWCWNRKTQGCNHQTCFYQVPLIIGQMANHLTRRCLSSSNPAMYRIITIPGWTLPAKATHVWKMSFIWRVSPGVL